MTQAFFVSVKSNTKTCTNLESNSARKQDEQKTRSQNMRDITEVPYGRAHDSKGGEIIPDVQNTRNEDLLVRNVSSGHLLGQGSFFKMKKHIFIN